MKKNKVIPLIVFVVVFLIIICVYFLLNSNTKYSCIDYRTDTYYEFNNEEEMHAVCDKFNGVDDDKIMDNYTIYNDLKDVNEEDFAFYPYINSDETLSITIVISNCDNPTFAKAKAEKWFRNHSYNINDYVIEYEYPCDYK